MAAEWFSPPARATDSNGNPYSGAKLYAYATGTTTPQAVYTTSALNVAHANPVVADSGGNFAPIYFDSSLTYRLVLKNSDGSVTLFDIDPANTGVLAAMAASGGSALVGFLQSGAGSVARTAQDKLREAPISPEDKGASGDNSTDDTAEIQAAIDAADAAGGGVVQLKSGRTYKTSAEIVVKAGIRFNMNEAKIRAVLSDASAAAVSLRTNSIVENGHIEVDSTGTPGAQAGCHAPIRIGSLYDSGGTVLDPADGDSPGGWIVRNMILESDKWVDSGTGDFIGAPGIQVMGGANNGVIDNITIPDSDRMMGAVHMDWGFLGSLLSSDTFANMTNNRTNFDAGTAYTTHPNNIVVRNIKVGALTATATGAQDVGSFAIRLSGCYNITVQNVEVKSVTYQAFVNTAGDLGFEFAPAAVKPFACKNIVFRNCSVEDCDTAYLVHSDSFADNVDRAARTAEFTASISGTTLDVSAVASGTLAVGHTVYANHLKVGVISAPITGAGGTGTYTLTDPVTTSSTSMNSGYGWLMDPLHETNIVFDGITGKGPGDSSANYGIRVRQQRGGTIINCDASYFKQGINIDERAFGVKVIAPHCHFNREDGIFVHHGTYPPQDTVISDAWCHDNGQDSGFGDPAGVHIGTSTRTKLERGRFGNATGTEATQEFGYRIGAGGAKATILYPEVIAFKSGGANSFIQTTDFSLVLRTSTQVAPVTVAQLTAAAAELKGARAVVTDSNAALTAGIGAVVAGGGANVVPVFCDGTNWRIG